MDKSIGQGNGRKDSCLIGIYQRVSGTAHHSRRSNMEPASRCLGPLEGVEYGWRKAAAAGWMEGPGVQRWTLYKSKFIMDQSVKPTAMASLQKATSYSNHACTENF